ncbi:hypothetical protein [Marinitoga sp. 38H-ov]|uniref:hypothetical protein n=1 Tax=Marinitoga sp. 38H-ov TaxID=1755814 RepID=UPI0013EB2B9D|nr:hypothetical protein [Marinitoga sp. 38H-ov]KAF2955480.1 hypothetical protein AS160_09770 [Marinitoga sp. 38H-ov]
MMNDEFKKEETLEIKIPKTSSKKSKNEGDNKNSIRLIIFLNIFIIAAIVYFLVNQYYLRLFIKNNIEDIKMKVTNLEGLNINLEKLNSNFQILDIINSNTRQIPDILIKLEENKKIFSNIDKDSLKDFKATLDELRMDISSIASNIKIKPENNIEKSINNIYSELLLIKNNLNNITYSDNTTNNSSTLIKYFENSLYSLNKEINKKFDDLEFKFLLIDKKLSSNINNNNFPFKEEFNNLEISIKKYLDELNNSFEKSIINLQNEYAYKEEQIYNKIEYLINKKEFIYLLNKFSDYFNSESFKLIEMVNEYNDLLIKYHTYEKDNEVKYLFNDVTKKTYEKFLETIIEEKNHLESTIYNENIMKDIKYINYIYSKLPKNKEYMGKIDSELKMLKELELKKLEEYNNLANYEMNNFLNLFSKKIISEKEVVENFENSILKINSELLKPDLKIKYLDLIKKTKQILKDKYSW